MESVRRIWLERRHMLALAFACACGAYALSGCGAGSQPPAAGVSLAGSPQVSLRAAGAPIAHSSSSTVPFRFFASTSFWNTPLPSNPTIDTNSAPIVKALAEQVRAEKQLAIGPWINTTSYSVPIYTVPVNQPTVRVALTHVPIALALQNAWTAVPLPANAHPATGTDGALVVWQPSTGKLWEFWRLKLGPEGWSAAWGGAMQKALANPGVYNSQAWPGAKSFWGSSASSLSIAGGLITFEDLQTGVINHALALAVPDPRAGVYASPARRDDGISTSPLSLPEGAHLRLNPSVDLARLHLPRLTLMIARAAKRYGIFVRDKAGNVTFYAQDPTPTGANPYAGPTGYFEGKYPAQLLASFPWKDLQLLKMELHAGP